MSSNQKLIVFAQEYLKKQPFDIVHDLKHHQLVVKNCVDIIREEKLTPDEEVVITSAWWHDVEKSYKSANSADSTVSFLKKIAREMHIDPAFVDQCVHTILQHSFRQSQTTLEGKILFDADKIEYVNDGRIAKLMNDFLTHPGKYPIDKLQEIHDLWVARIKKVPDMMHFAYSKKIFLTKVKATENILDKLQKAIDSEIH